MVRLSFFGSAATPPPALLPSSSLPPPPPPPKLVRRLARPLASLNADGKEPGPSDMRLRRELIIYLFVYLWCGCYSELKNIGPTAKLATLKCSDNLN